jgi:hypothetical protein
MKRLGKKLAAATLVAGLALPAAALAADDVQQKLDALQKDLADLKAQVKKNDDKSMEKWLTIGGDYRFRVDSLYGKVPSYSQAIGTMSNMVGAFTAPVAAGGVAGETIGGLTSPTATQFIMQGKSGVLFTPAQFNTILNLYMPQAMYNAFTGPIMTNLGTIMAGGSPAVNAALQGTALTRQQTKILETMKAKVIRLSWV